MIAGTRGSDTLGGGAGADQFIFTIVDSSRGSGVDHITDFSHSEHDLIVITSIDANVDMDRDQDFTFIGEATFHGNAGELRFTDNGDGTMTVQGDTNGDRHADFQLLVTIAQPLVASDFPL